MKKIFNNGFTKIFKIYFIAIFIFFISNLLFATEHININLNSDISYENQTYYNYYYEPPIGTLYNGGVFFNAGKLTLNNCCFLSNKVDFHGGAIWGGSNDHHNSQTIINNVMFSSNTANFNGGAICIDSKSVLLISSGTKFINNIAIVNGGAISSVGITTIESNVIFGLNIANNRGGAISNCDTLTIKGNVKFFYNSCKTNQGGAIYNFYNGILNLIADTKSIEFTGNTANGVSNAIHDNNGIINLWASSNADIIFNDRITSENDKSILNINRSTTTLNAIGKIILNEDMAGYTGQVNLYDGIVAIGEKGTWFGGNTFVKNATINMINEKTQQHNFNNLQVEDKLNLVVDADLENKQMDTIVADSFDGVGNINVYAINILTDDNKKETTKILFTSSTILKNKIKITKNTNSTLYKYNIIYNNGYLDFINIGINTQNPIFESQVAKAVGCYITQTTIFNQAFASMENIRSRIFQVKNEIPADAPLYASRANTIFFQKTNRIESGLWLRPFYSQETVNLDNLSVDNTLTGTLAGLDLATGENSLLSLYLGYAGSEQKYENIKINQTGYILGVTGMLVKEQWYAGLTANINFNKAESQSSYGTDNFDMNMYSVGAKAGYNYEINDNWTLEPNLMLMYGNVNSQEYQTTQGAKIEGQSIANIIFEPQIKAKLNLENGWQPYGLIGYVINAGDKVTTKIEEVEFDGKKIGNYVEFGAGIDKSFKNSPWSLYIQLTGRSGDRTGFDGNFGIKYSFLTAKEKKKISKIKKIQAKRKAKEEFEQEQRRIKQEREKAEYEKQQELEIQKQIEQYY